MAKSWTCRGCGTVLPRTKPRCACGRARPAPRRPAHAEVLDIPYEKWVEQFGEVCGICGRPPSATRRLDRDHDHRSGNARGLLCFRDNKALPTFVTVEWLRAALAYLEAAEERQRGREA